jgi:ParB family chromosome partitioning protein
MALQLDGFDLLAEPGGLLGGVPLQLRLEDIDEDPAQPRVEFDPAPLEELAATIRERGVRQPVSVRPHPNQPGRWLLNFGARRLRASKLAGLTTIPAFEDATADDYDQVIENEQRAGLTALELALFVQRRLQVGDTQAEVARRLGKSRQYLTFVTALIDAPAWLMALYRSGRCRGLNELYALRKLSGNHAVQVVAWLSDLELSGETISRERVLQLRTALEALPAAGADVAAPLNPHPESRPHGSDTEPRNGVKRAGSRPPRALRLAAPSLLADLDGTEVVVDTVRLPSTEGWLFVRAAGDAEARCVEARRLLLRGLRLASPI